MTDNPYGQAHAKKPTPPPTRPWATADLDDRDGMLLDLVIDHRGSTIKQLWQMMMRQHHADMTENDTRRHLIALGARGYVACSDDHRLSKTWSVVAELKLRGGES